MFSYILSGNWFLGFLADGILFSFVTSIVLASVFWFLLKLHEVFCFYLLEPRRFLPYATNIFGFRLYFLLSLCFFLSTPDWIKCSHIIHNNIYVSNRKCLLMPFPAAISSGPRSAGGLGDQPSGEQDDPGGTTQQRGVRPWSTSPS